MHSRLHKNITIFTFLKKHIYIFKKKLTTSWSDANHTLKSVNISHEFTILMPNNDIIKAIERFHGSPNVRRSVKHRSAAITMALLYKYFFFLIITELNDLLNWTKLSTIISQLTWIRLNSTHMNAL